VRILVAHPGPHFSVADVHAGYVEAFRGLGVATYEYNLDDRLAFYGSVLMETEEQGRFKRALTSEQAIELAINGLYAALVKVCPDVLVVISAFFTPPALLSRAREIGIKVVVVHTECPYEDERQLALAPYADLNLVNDPVGIEQFRALAPTQYMPHAYRPSVHHPGPAEPGWCFDLCFVGTGFPSRVDFFEGLDLDGLNVGLAGNWSLLGDRDSPLLPHVLNEPEDCIDNTEAAGLYRSSRCGLNLYRREHKENDTADGWAMGPREVEMAACGLPFVRDPRPESDGVFSFLPTFTSPEEAADQIRWLLADEDRRLVLAEKAQQAIADRTFDGHAARLLRLLEKEIHRGT
jgi:spore maturation protein CgeB